LFVLLLFDTGQARIWRWLPQSACQSEFSKKFRLEETVWRTTKPEKKRNGGSVRTTVGVKLPWRQFAADRLATSQ